MNTKKRIMTAALSVLCVAALATGCGKVNVGYVDESRIQSEAPQIKASVEELQTRMTEFQAEAEQQFQEAANNDASDEDMQALQQQLQIKAAGIQQQYSTMIKSKVDAAMNDIVKEKELDTVLSSNGKDGVVVSGGTDITDDVIQKLQ